MKKETYYINEFTGEVLTDEVKTLAAEHLEALRIEKEIRQDFKLIQDFCDSHGCAHCPFFHGDGTLCIVNAFSDAYFEGD